MKKQPIECKNNEKSHIHYQDIQVVWKLYLLAYTPIHSSTVVYGGDILSFHIFEALNDNFEA